MIRLQYLTSIFENSSQKGLFYYSIFKNISDYNMATVMAIAKTIYAFDKTKTSTSTVYIDALRKEKRHTYGSELRKLGASTKKVQGVAKDESNELIRLADALAGFIRDVLYSSPSEELLQLFNDAKRKKIIQEV